MSSLAIRHMNFTLHEMEQIEAQKSAAWYASLTDAERSDRSHYWFIERKARRGKGWIYVHDYVGTKSEAAVFFCKHLRDRDDKFRLRHMLIY